MAYEELNLDQLIGRAYARALPPKKFVKLVQTRLASSNDVQNSEDDVAAAILPYLLPSPPSLILSYLSQLLESGLMTSRTIFIHLLFYLRDHDIPSLSSIISITNILITHSTGLEEPIASLLLPPGQIPSIPNIGASTSTNSRPGSTLSSPKISKISTLSLILPLLRLITTNNHPSSLVGYLSKFVSVLSNFPTPSLDIGLEAGGLLSNLPEEISLHLRVMLSDLMMDLDNQDLIQQSQAQNNQIQSNLDQSGNNGINQDIQTNDGGQKGELNLPLNQSMRFLIEWAKRSNKSAMNEDQDLLGKEPKKSWKSILRSGKDLTNDPNEFLSVLLEVTIQNLVGSNVETLISAENWGVLVEDICKTVKWWKDHSNDNFPFPSDIVSSLSSIFQTYLPSMQTYSEQLTQRYNNVMQHAENEDEGSSFTPLEGWPLLSLQETLISKFVELGIINQEQASTIAPGVNVYTFTPGESLINRISSESHPHLPPLVHTTQYSYSASLTFTTELIQTIRSCPITLPPENLFNFIASQPGLIGVIESHIAPSALLNILQKQLLDLGVDEQSRNDDPQGSLTRFGEGVTLVEAFVAHYQLPLPPLLEDARRADHFAHLPENDRECMNGWIKAIFGSDGIEDAILLATPPQKLYKLAPTLIQQAIAAVAASQIDLDTLHSGLSYFSQPLLSWCLGGVVAWLCKEIKRQGSLAALHLVVLQDLILGHSCPESLLRVNSKSLNELLNPNSGLSDVINTSNFDIIGIRNKLDSLGLNASLPINEIGLKGVLQQIRQIELMPIGWEKSLLDTINKEVEWNGKMETMKLILNQCLTSINLDSLVGFTPLLLSVNLQGEGSLFEILINSSWLSSSLQNFNIHTTSNLILQIYKKSLLFNSAFHPKSSDLISILIDEFEYLLSKPIRGENDIVANGDVNGNNKKRKLGTLNTLNTTQRNLVESLVKGLRDDEDLRNRFGGLSRLDQLL